LFLSNIIPTETIILISSWQSLASLVSQVLVLLKVVMTQTWHITGQELWSRGDSMAHTWPSPLGHPPGPDIWTQVSLPKDVLMIVFLLLMVEKTL
jgi:hypothetical protein